MWGGGSDLSGDEWRRGGGRCIRDSWGMNASTTQEVSARRNNTRWRRSCFVAKREVEETNLGMWNDKKTGGGTIRVVIFIVGVRLDAWADQVDICTGHRTAHSRFR